jgi:hypothetical protein
MSMILVIHHSLRIPDFTFENPGLYLGEWAMFSTNFVEETFLSDEFHQISIEAELHEIHGFNLAVVLKGSSSSLMHGVEPQLMHRNRWWRQKCGMWEE